MFQNALQIKKNLKVAMLFHKGTLIDAKEKQIMVIICTNVYASW